MAEPAFRAMTLDEFLSWDDGTDTRYELIGGFPVAMAPPAVAHGALAVRLGARIDAALTSRRPCMVQSEAGIIRSDRADSYFIADLAATCAPYNPGSQTIANPLLIVEILSPGTERHDRRIKLPVYRQIDSVEEILFIDSGARYAELHRRQGAQWIVELFRGAEEAILLASVQVSVRMDELYEGLVFDDALAG